MKSIIVHTLNAFASKMPGGNPAGVVLEADALSEEQMQNAAKIIGFSETAFVSCSENADFRLRYFTPEDEVDLCGHATVAAFALMAAQQRISPGRYTIETNAGRLEAAVRENGEAFLMQASPSFGEEASRQQIAEALGLSPEDLEESLPIQVVSTGLRDILVPIRSKIRLTDIRPDFEAISALSRLHDTIGIHAFTLDAPTGMTAVCRNFAPLYGIPEESATGTSNGALACYLQKYGKLDGQENKKYVCLFEQGHLMDLPSIIRAELSLDAAGDVLEVSVGGHAVSIGVQKINVTALNVI